MRIPFYRWEGAGNGTLPSSGLTGARTTLLSPTYMCMQAHVSLGK